LRLWFKPIIKRVLAYSTMSRFGYMFLALGVQAWDAAIFHLMTHAFFKAFAVPVIRLGDSCLPPRAKHLQNGGAA